MNNNNWKRQFYRKFLASFLLILTQNLIQILTLKQIKNLNLTLILTVTQTFILTLKKANKKNANE